LGTDYRFHTKILPHWASEKDGTLQGDLILVASGDLESLESHSAGWHPGVEDEIIPMCGRDSKG